MEKIFKKSLALMVSAALCLTAFVGCLTVNAEATATPTYTITAQNGKAGDTVTVNVDGNNLTSVCGQQVFINIPAALTIASVKDNAGNPYINVANVTEGDAFDYSVVTTETTKQVRFADIINFPATGSDGAIATAEFHIVFELTIPDTAAVGATYEIAFDTATMFANIDENAIGITVEPKTITVQAAVAEPVGVASTYAHSISFESSLELNIYLSKTDEWASCDMLYMDVEKEDYSSGTLSYVTSRIQVDSMTPVTISGVQRYRFVFDGFDSRQLGDWFTGTVYGVDAEGNVLYVSSNSDRTCVLDYCKGRFVNSANVNLKKLCAAVLNYGAQAQKFFGNGYRLDALVNEGADIVEYISTYTDSTERILNATSEKSGTGIDILNGLNCQSKIELICAVKVASVADYDLNDLRFVLNYNDKTVNIPGSEFVTAGSNYYGYLSILKSNELSKDITIELYNGDTLVSITRTYSVEAYGMEQISKHSSEQKYADFYTSMIKYGDASVAYFG